jgi:hypothetical protein
VTICEKRNCTSEKSESTGDEGDYISDKEYCIGEKDDYCVDERYCSKEIEKTKIPCTVMIVLVMEVDPKNR